MGCDSGRFRFLLGSAGRGLCCVKAPFRAPTCTPTTYTGFFGVQRASLVIKEPVGVIGVQVFGIVEIEARDFYFEISPEDYQDEEANICNNKKALTPQGELWESVHDYSA